MEAVQWSSTVGRFQPEGHNNGFGFLTLLSEPFDSSYFLPYTNRGLNLFKIAGRTVIETIKQAPILSDSMTPM